MKSHADQSSTVQLSIISRCDRWQVSQRLQDLEIPCSYSSEGHLVAEIKTPTDLLQLQSVLQQLIASRPELIRWLETCWQAN
jgi:hypothetical protein